MGETYICSNAKMICSYGSKQSVLTVLPSRAIFITGQPQANISDHIPLVNIAPFGKCHTVAYPATGAATAAAHGKLTPMPCVPNTPFPWMNGKNDVILQGCPALINTSTCRCVYGGVIKIVFDGQPVGSPPNLQKEDKQDIDYFYSEPDENKKISVLDAIQTTLDVAGFVPGFGAVPDLLNAAISALRGNWTDAAMSLLAAVPLIGDSAQAAKLGYKGYKLAKGASKVSKARKAEIAAVAKKYRAINITPKTLLKKGLCKNADEVEVFQKALRQERRDFATEFYKRKGIPEKEIPGHVNGINLDKAVSSKKMPPPERVRRYEDIEGHIGSYQAAAREPFPKSEWFGIIGETKKGKKVIREYKVSKDAPVIEFLKSTAAPISAPINNNWKTGKWQFWNWRMTRGGATQMFVGKDDLKFFTRVF